MGKQHGFSEGRKAEINMLDFGFHNMNCMDGMKQFPDRYFDLAIVDPEYGRKEHGGKKEANMYCREMDQRFL